MKCNDNKATEFHDVLNDVYFFSIYKNNIKILPTAHVFLKKVDDNLKFNFKWPDDDAKTAISDEKSQHL
jgi:hypothetical protein